VWVAPPTTEIGCSLETWGGAGERSNRSAISLMTTSDSVSDHRGGFSGVNLSDEDIAAVGTVPRGRLSRWTSAHILVYNNVIIIVVIASSLTSSSTSSSLLNSACHTLSLVYS